MAAYSPLEADTNTLRASIADIPLSQVMGRDSPMSEHGIAYDMIIKGPESGTPNNVEYYVAWCEQFFLSKKDQGYTTIVWREKPTVMDYEEKRSHTKRMVLNFHLLPRG